MKTNVMIKNNLLLVFFFMSSLMISAQEEVVVPLSNAQEKGKLNMYLLNGSISVVSHNSNDVIVRANVRASKKNKEKYKNGLRKINANAVRFSVEEVDNNVYVKSKNINTITDFEISVPKNFDLKLSVTNNGNVYIENIEGTLVVSNTNGKIDMKNISGSVIADALNKNITVTFDKVYKNDMAFSSLNGNLDITFPSDLKADVKAKTDNGAIFTDFELKMVDKKANIEKTKTSKVYKVNVDKWTYGTINGGGPELLFKTLNGDIIIRKK